MHHHIATVRGRITRFAPQICTMFTHTLYRLFESLFILKGINNGDIFKAIMTEEKFAKSKRHRINGNVCPP